MNKKIKIQASPETHAIFETAKRARNEVASWPAWKRGEAPRVPRDLTDSPFLAAFPTGRAFLPVLHHASFDALRENLKIVSDAGAQGVFVINQGIDTLNLLHHVVPEVRDTYPTLWLGVNLLGTSFEEALLAPNVRGVDGIWRDNAGVDAQDEQIARAAEREVYRVRDQCGWKGLLFGGVAFKTQAEIAHNDLPSVAKRAARYVDVVTTSGSTTGVPAQLAKVQILRTALPATALALASGITPENVDAYLPYTDAFLVASGIEREFGVLDAAKTIALGKKINDYRG